MKQIDLPVGATVIYTRIRREDGGPEHVLGIYLGKSDILDDEFMHKVWWSDNNEVTTESDSHLYMYRNTYLKIRNME